MDELVECTICKKEFRYGTMYEYRGAISCWDCFDKLQVKREAERQGIIAESRHKTDRFKGLDLGDSQIGKANRTILKADIEIAKKEGKRIRDYEGRN